MIDAQTIVFILLEAGTFDPDAPVDPKAELDRLLPTKKVTLRGSTMIHAPGVIRMAQRSWQMRGAKSKKFAQDVLRSWPGLKKEIYTAILNGQCRIETAGDDAVITIENWT